MVSYRSDGVDICISYLLLPLPGHVHVLQKYVFLGKMSEAFADYP